MFDDPHLLRERARAAVDRGEYEDAIQSLLAAAGHTYWPEHDYATILRPLEQAFTRCERPRSALTVLAYLGSNDASAMDRAAALLHRVPPAERAPVLASQGRMADAAHEMEEAGQIAAAAVYREKARDWSAARTLWSRLASRMAVAIEGGEDAYVTALVRFDLARCARLCGDAAQAREAIVASVRLLEEAADHFESIGRRERAFDCFQVLVQIGREGGAFEDVLEGFVNSIRILREDHLKYDFALELFEEAIAAASTRGEARAAATLARQASEYARSVGLTQASTGYALRQADLWRAVAKAQAGLGAPAEVAENALLAAVVAFGEIGQFEKVGATYRELSALDLEPSRREHYARAAKRYRGVHDEPLEAASMAARPPRRDASQTEVWHVDVLEWERRGDAVPACADVLFDRRWADLIRRKAMLARLAAIELERTPPSDAAGARIRLAEELGQVQLYAVLSPLEKLFADPDRGVKVAVLQALQTLSFKRSFVTVQAALRDRDPVIVESAARVVESLTFPHAVDPLSRIFRESPQPTVRLAAIRALARVDTPEAAEVVLGAIEHGAPADRRAALGALREGTGTALMDLARGALLRTTGDLRDALREAMEGRGRDR
ncbi:MAG TPA: HEAT repeat domain-containing protein [Polyangiaceae bacterium]